MRDLQEAKNVVRQFHSAVDTAPPEAMKDLFRGYVGDDFLWRGVHPFNVFDDSDQVVETFWIPLRTALSRMQRRDDIFFAGANEIDGGDSVWVVSMGHLMGLFDAPFLGIHPTGKMVMLRYCTFHRIADGRISETVMHVDIPHLMTQAGQNPFPPQTGEHLIQPGPQTHDGLLFGAQSEAEATATRSVISGMVRNLGMWQSGLPLEEELALDWHDDMIWWGPAGIGASYTIERYAKQHAGPFRAAFSNRSSTKHIARLAEGHYGGFFGWPNFTADLTGEFMGMPPTGRTGEFRVIDIYRRSGDKLVENWVFIDLAHFWKQQGIDILEDHQDPK